MDQIWWNHIIKAHAFLENVVKEAAGEIGRAHV